MIRKFIYHLTHNILINNLIISLGAENKFKSVNGIWSNFKYDTKKSLQENVGFSHREDVEEAIKIVHGDLFALYTENEKSVKSILDLGCGTGLYLKDFENTDCDLFGLDLSQELLNAAVKHISKAKFICDSYLNTKLLHKMNLIYSISVMEYISRNDLKFFFEKLHGDLESDGLIFIQYPHAISLKDTYYPDLNYIKYSPSIVEQYASRYFEIVRHSHGYTKEKKVHKYDRDPLMIRGGSFVNGYVLIGRKKNGIG